MKKLSFVLILLAATFVQVANAAATKEEADAAYQKTISARLSECMKRF